jgi:hypothetical protein
MVLDLKRALINAVPPAVGAPEHQASKENLFRSTTIHRPENMLNLSLIKGKVEAFNDSLMTGAK